MFFTGIINVFIGLAMIYGTLALIVSAATEGLSSLLKLRSATLVQGLRQLLNDPDLTGLAGQILNHGGAHPCGPGTTDSPSPSYISPAGFAAALVDTLRQGGQVGQKLELGPAIAAMADPQLKTMLQGMHDRVNGDVQAFHDAVGKWFDASMDRIGGTYKRKVQLISFLIALAAAIGLNIDSFHIARALWNEPTLVQTASTDFQSAASGGTGNPQAASALSALVDSNFPFGWNNGLKDFWDGHPFDTLATILGWLSAAIASLFGAPFWFDTLQRFTQIRGTGKAPGQGK